MTGTQRGMRMVEHGRDDVEDRRTRWVRIVVAYVILFCFIGAVLALVVGEWRNDNLRTLMTSHFRATVGLPVAGLFAFLVVALFRSTEGRVRFEVFGLKFDGASGPIVLWILC